MMQTKPHIKSKQRVSDHGEVFTPDWIVNDMLDLVKQETERIDSRFLEPACGTGNFLVEILRRKLLIVEQRYCKNQIEYERYAIIAISSIYGIDLLEDNIEEARKRLYDIFEEYYFNNFQEKCKKECKDTVKFILKKNIVRGDALTLKINNNKPIIFSEWSAVNGSMIKRRDFTFTELLEREKIKNFPIFAQLEEETVTPTPIKEYPLTHFLKLADQDE